MELNGRRVIYCDENYVTVDNVVDVITNAVPVHTQNAVEELELYGYYKGRQAIREKQKYVREEINHRICENRAKQIVDFKTGYLVGEAIQYTSRVSDGSDDVSKLNSMMLSESKSSKDKELSDWMHICGVGYRIVLPNTETGISPFKIHVLEPMNTFIVYSSKLGHKPLCGVYFTQDKEKNKTYSVYTDTEYFEVKEGKVVSHTTHALGSIPIVEYPLNMARIGVFEQVIDLLDAINEMDSDRMDSLQQFVNALLVLKNCELPEGATAETIRQAGMIILKSTGENPADLDILAEQLDQQQNQTLKEDIYNAVLSIVGMPAQGDGNGSDSSNNGAMLLKQGWQNAEARAKDTELSWTRSEFDFLKIVLTLCNGLTDVRLSPSDITIKFTRRFYQDQASKSTVLATLLGTGYVSPEDAYAASGLFFDVEDAVKRGLAWHDSLMKEIDGEPSSN